MPKGDHRSEAVPLTDGEHDGDTEQEACHHDERGPQHRPGDVRRPGILRGGYREVVLGLSREMQGHQGKQPITVRTRACLAWDRGVCEVRLYWSARQHHVGDDM